MVEVTWSQRLTGMLAYPLSLFILLLALIWVGKYRDGIVWSSTGDAGDPYQTFNLHPIMMALGMFVFPTQAVLVYRILPMDRSKAKIYHLVCHLFSLICIAIGVAAVIAFHERTALPHFRSLHSWFGLGTLALFALQFVLGFISFCFPKLPFGARRSFAPLHQYLGVLCFGGGCITGIMGITQKIIDVRVKDSTVDSMGAEVQLANWMGVSVMGLFTFVLYTIYSAVGKRQKGRREPATVEEVEALTDKGNNGERYEHDYDE